MDIKVRLNKNFQTQYNKLQAEFGTEIASLNGFDDEMLKILESIKKEKPDEEQEQIRIEDVNNAAQRQNGNYNKLTNDQQQQYDQQQEPNDKYVVNGKKTP